MSNLVVFYLFQSQKKYLSHLTHFYPIVQCAGERAGEGEWEGAEEADWEGAGEGEWEWEGSGEREGEGEKEVEVEWEEVGEGEISSSFLFTSKIRILSLCFNSYRMVSSKSSISILQVHKDFNKFSLTLRYSLFFKHFSLLNTDIFIIISPEELP